MPVILLSSVSMAHRYFLEEVEAFRVARAQIDSVVPLKPAAHAVAWACTLDDILKRESLDAAPNSPKWQTPYELTRNAHQYGRCMLGIRYVRNRLMHEFVDVLDTADGAAFPIEFPAPFHEFVWLPVSELPPPDPEHPDPILRQNYEAELAGQVVRMTFGRVQAFFAEAVHGHFAEQVP